MTIALLVIDLQEGYIDGKAQSRYDAGLIPRINSHIAKCAQSEKMIVYIQNLKS